MKKAKKFLLYVFTLFILTISVQAQSAADSTITKKSEKKYQAKAPKTQPFGAKAFRRSNKTTLRWLGMAGYFINSRGTTMMVDPLLKGFDMPVMIDFPIAPKDIPRLDAVLVTHADNDHYSVPTNRDLLPSMYKVSYSILNSRIRNTCFDIPFRLETQVYPFGCCQVNMRPFMMRVNKNAMIAG